MLQLQNISVGHGSHELFREVSLSFSGKDRKRIALLGDNGCGKSTLLDTILGLTPPVRGTLTVVGEKILRIDQQLEFPEELIGEIMENTLTNSWEDYRLPMVLEEVGLPEDVLLRTPQELSGGQQMRLAFALALLQEATILLMDEPTNHLDTEGLQWLGTFIQNFSGSVIIITHDRAFIETYMNELWYVDLTQETVRTYRGSYTEFLAWKQAEEEHLRNAYELVEQRKQSIIRWLRQHEFHPKYQFSSIVMSKKRTLAALDRIERVKPIESKKIQVQEGSGIRKDQLLLKMQVTDHPFIRKSPLVLSVRSHSKIRITGPNGSGKTTMLKLLLGELQSPQVEVEMRDDLRIAFMAQDARLPMDRKVITVAHEMLPNYSEPQVRSLLHKLYFTHEDILHPVGSFSPGEQRKLELGLLLATKPELLLLDEPTNHMDIVTREIIEELLQETSTAVVFISHDEYFCRQIVCTEVLSL